MARTVGLWAGLVVRNGVSELVIFYLSGFVLFFKLVIKYT